MDLDEAERLLASKGYEIVANHGVMLVVRREVEMTLYPHGRILMHPVKAREDAHRHASDLYEAMGL